MSEATLTSKGQITIPADIRSAMGLTSGEKVVFTRLPDGTTVLRAKKRTLESIRGVLKARVGRRKIAIAKMNIGRD